MNTFSRPIAVLGAGAWGTALANSIAHKGHVAVLIDRDDARAHAIADARENARAEIDHVAKNHGSRPALRARRSRVMV